MTSMKKENRGFAVLCAFSVLWTLFIFWHSLQTADVSSAESGRILAFLRQFLPFLSHTFLRKMGHFTEFAVLGVLLALTLRAKGAPARVKALPTGLRCWGLPLGLGLLAALCDEGIQLFVPGRSAEVRDILIDVSGVLLGAAVVRTAGLVRAAGRRNQSVRPDEAADPDPETGEEKSHA